MGLIRQPARQPVLALPHVRRISEGPEFLMGMGAKLVEALGSRPAAGVGEPLTGNPEGVAVV
jgi:hypothetical protein